MKRLLCSITAAAALIITPASRARSDDYTLAGDAVTPGTSTFAPGQAVYTRDLLDQAGRVGSTGNALILRGCPLQPVATDVIHPAMTDKGSRLAAGDVVIYRDTSDDHPADFNVVVKAGDALRILRTEQRAVAATQIFAELQLPPAATFPVIRTTWGTARRIEADPAQMIQHGDVVDLSTVHINGPAIAHLYSSSPESDIVASGFVRQVSAGAETGSAFAQPIPALNGTTMIVSPAILPIPDDAVRLEAADPSAEDASTPRNPESHRTSAVSGVTTPVQMELITLPADRNDTGLSNKDPNNTGPNVSGQNNSGQNNSGPNNSGQNNSAPARKNRPAEGTDVFHTAAFESAVDTGTTTAKFSEPPAAEATGGFANLVFAMGMLAAAGLIVLGWLRTQQEQQAAQQQPRVFGNDQQSTFNKATMNSSPTLGIPAETIARTEASPIASTEIRNTTYSASEQKKTAPAAAATTAAITPIAEASDSRGPDAEPVVAELLATETHTETTASTDEDMLVHQSEWFSGAWQTVTSQLPPEVHSVETPLPQMPERRMSAAEPAVAAQQPDPIADTQNTETEIAGEQNTEARVMDAQAADTLPTDTLPTDTLPVFSEVQPDSDLEALLTNRLPVRLRQTELPLRVTLYGRPIGPRRLRIDAAHTQLAPPHMAMTRQNSKSAEPIAAAVAPSKAEGRGTQVTSTTKSAGNSGAKPDSGRLDRALNSLQERTDT
ncbi:MAG: hypothetical protein KDA89_22550 [Planctomycetaceae bacterium]|nr:hypothetical protein [Planctomycetaceae bacterium]